MTSFNLERRVGGPVESAVSPMKLSIEDHRSRRQFVRVLSSDDLKVR